MANTIFDNWKDNRYEEAKEWLTEQAKELALECEDDYEEPTEKEIWDEVYSREECDWEDAKHDMDKFFEGETVILRGTVGRWNGHCDGWEYGDFKKLYSDLLQDCDYMTFEDSRGHFEISGVHHDGSNYGEVRILTEAGIRAIEDWEYGYRFENLSDKEIIEKVWNSRHYCRIPHFAKKIYGCKEVA